MSDPKPTEHKPRTRRPSVAKTTQTRQAIVAAALDVFLERGFSDARMEDVAARAGVAKGTVYRYFTDKEALFEGVLREVIAVPLAHLTLLLPEPGESLRDAIWRAVLPIVRDMERSKRAPVFRLILAESSRFPALARMFRALVFDPVADMIQRLAQRGVETGELTTDALVKFPHLMIAPNMLAVLWNGVLDPEHPLDMEAMFAAHLDIVFGISEDTSSTKCHKPL
ncbi:MAG: TetR/AcrR family transcriptional regulator [Capsulimonas sp.]|uniref:TetR/AcrR family transcriptional regulator n=1 Tax=Capsulimonas sp. TaxID=2494211 RepID=UPI0032661795